MPSVSATATSSETAVVPFADSPRSYADSDRSAARQRMDDETPAATSEWRDFELPQATIPPAARAPAYGKLCDMIFICLVCFGGGRESQREREVKER